MRATEAYFEAKKAEIERMEEVPESVPPISDTASMPSVPPMPVSASAPVATPVPLSALATNPLTDCPKEVSIGTEDGILLKCIERYIESNRFSMGKLENLKDILAIWCGYNGIISDSMREKIDRCQERIVDIQKENTESKPSMTVYNNGEYYADNAQKKIYSK